MDTPSPNEVVTLITMEYLPFDDDLIETTLVRRDVETAQTVADVLLSRNRFVKTVGTWGGYGLTVGGSRSIMREIEYDDGESGRYSGWQLISDVSTGVLNSRTP